MPAKAQYPMFFNLRLWLVSDWRTLIPMPWANISLVLIAVLCGAMVGMEREKKEKPAGILTLTLVSLGAAIFTMVSFVFVGDKGNASRVAAQVVTGVGFLGAGVILRGGVGVRGTATAATIWTSAAIGMVAGVGYGTAAIGLTMLALAVLMVVSRIDRELLHKREYTNVRIIFDPNGGKTLVKIEEALDINEVHAAPAQVHSANGLAETRLKYCHSHRNHREFLAQLAQMPEVKEIHRGNTHENNSTGSTNLYPYA